MTTPAFRKGAEQAKEAAPKGGGSADYGWFTLKENEDGIVLRYLTDADEWITVDQHYAPTRPKPSDWPEGSNWPRGMSAVCRNDEALRAMYGDCYICANVKDEDGEKITPKPRTWALAAVREEVRENGKVVGVRDVMVEDDDGNEVPKVVVVNQAYSNFFGNAQAFAGRYDTVLDRDYFVDRTGKGAQTAYPHVPLDPLKVDLGDDEVIDWDVREEAVLEYYMADRESLEDVVSNKASDEFYALFFDETKPQPSRGKKDDDDSSETEPTESAASNGASSGKPDPDKLASIRARVSKG